jgi:uncharacterized cupredoxin-like copper-binding protein
MRLPKARWTIYVTRTFPIPSQEVLVFYVQRKTFSIPSALLRFPALALVIGLLGIAGCGGDDGDKSATTSTTSSDTQGGKSLKIQMGEFYFKPKDVTVESGRVKITAPNVGKAEHELVIFKTDRDPGSFPLSGNRVDEKNLKGAEDVGEIADVGAGETKNGSFELKPGKYAMICNIPGHYKSGMYGSMTAR